jgi:hypothetical protein
VYKKIQYIGFITVNKHFWRFRCMQVKIFDYGADEGKYYVVYKITGLDLEDRERLRGNVEGDVEMKDGEIFITTHFEEKYFPFGSEAAHCRIEDFIAREEIEMTVYLTSILEDE